MKFIREQSSDHWIKGYSATEIRVGERVLQASCLISAEHLVADWRPRAVSELSPADFDEVFKWQPEILLLGTGETQLFPDRTVYSEVLSRHIGFEVMTTGAACRTFNVLLNENRRVVAALIF